MDGYTDVSQVPNSVCIYALYAGKGRNQYVVNVGKTKHLRKRINEHLIACDRNTATAAARLNPSQVTGVRWWKFEEYADQPERLEAAELVAFNVLKPVLGSNGNPTKSAKAILEKDTPFETKMSQRFKSEPSGHLRWGGGVDLENILERLSKVESELAQIKKTHTASA
jgi:hypothetical protein